MTTLCLLLAVAALVLGVAVCLKVFNGGGEPPEEEKHPKRKTLYLLLAVPVMVLAGTRLFKYLNGAGSSGGDFSSGSATRASMDANANLAKSLNLADQQDFEDAKRGLIAAPNGKVLAKDGSVIWDFDRFRFVEGDAPPTVNPSLWRHAKLNKTIGLFKVMDGIYQLRGFDLANITIIEGKTGWIVQDGLSCRETAEAAMAFARKHLGNRPVSALLISHSHMDHFGGLLGVISDEEVKRRRIPIVAPAGFMEEATSENVLVGKAMGRRAMWQFGTQLPASAKGLVDCGIGNAIGLGEFGILQPTVIVDHTPQEMTIDGIRFVFQNIPQSEAPAEMAFYLPDFKAFCGAEILNQTLHQILTLRGAKVRDTLLWAGYIDESLQRFGDAEVYFALHNWPVWGNGRVVEFMKKHRDTYKYIHDQTVRMINAGMRPDEIADAIKLPASLETFFAVRGYYGTARRNARAVYQHYLGWFDGNPAHLDPLPRQDASRRYVELMGGGEQVLKAAQEAFTRGEYQWVAELLNHVVFAQPDWKPPRELLARTYDQLGYGAECPLDRNLYLTGAQELRSGKSGPSPEPVKSMELMAQMPIENFLIAMAATLDGPAAEGKDFKINIVFSDLGESYLLWLENAVLHHRKGAPAGNADATLTLTKGMFLKLVVGKGEIKDLLGDGIRVTGSKIDLVRFFSLFKKPGGTFPIVTP
ncbi:MAG: MBL fold metallo-hydrolase [Syntrophales bacterium]|jgi:alkyl sulfatase BDS1-like metallo-beta-lactamase superfamily hydrolase|nr:MBL fold metallo-hydrolase [Syntrophales bacterium]